MSQEKMPPLPPAASMPLEMFLQRPDVQPTIKHLYKTLSAENYDAVKTLLGAALMASVAAPPR